MNNICSCECGCDEIIDDTDYPLCDACNNEECYNEDEDLDH